MAKDIWKRPGGKTWYLNIWDPVNGKKIKKALGPSKRRAEQIAAEWRAGLYAGDPRYRPNANSVTLDEFIPRLLKEHFEGKRYYPEARRTLMRFRAFAGNRALAGITKGLLQQYVARRQGELVPSPFRGIAAGTQRARAWEAENSNRRQVSKATVNRDIAVIKCMVNRAVEWGELTANLLTGFRKFSEKQGIRKRYLHPPEIKALLQAVASLRSKTLLPIELLALYVGRRQGEILNLKRQDFDRENGYLYFRKTKKGEPDQVPVPPAAQRVLEKLCDEGRCDWVFPNDSLTGPVRRIGTAFELAKRRAGITNFRFHDIRHTAVSYMVMAGVDYFTISQLAGHTTPTMIEQRYGHLSPKHRQASAVLFGSYMDRLTGEQPAQAAVVPMPEATPIVTQVAGLLTGGLPALPSH